ncbi:MAG TPA: hypothetical protein VM008_19405 [Phycisphaerae bacterium]|nr:hypothetical protein [Phycisphaerae bacterium]
MNRVVSIFCAFILLLAAAGCVPDRVVWAPDGSRAAVLGDDGLHLCDPDGKISPMLAAKASAVQWMPDGNGLVVEQEVEMTSWKEIQEAFPDETQRFVDSKRSDAVGKELLAFDGDWSNLVGPLEQKLSMNDQELKWSLIYLRDHDAAALKQQLGDRWDAVASVTFPARSVRGYQVSGETATAGPVLRYLNHEGLQALRLSPDGRAVAITWTDEKGERANLTVVATDGSGRVSEFGPAAMYPDWSADGKYLVYVRPNGVPEKGGNVYFGTLSRRQVFDADGKLLDASNAPPAEDLAGLLFDTNLRVRVAKDGRIFFVGAEVTLPATAADVEPKAQLFSIDPGRQATVTRMVPRSDVGKIGDAPQFFELSPDARHASVPFNDGRVSVVDLATGRVEMVQSTPIGDDDKMHLSSVPTWRSANELTFVRPGSEVPEVVRYSLADKSVVVMSKEWPKEVAKDWLSRKEATTQP